MRIKSLRIYLFLSIWSNITALGQQIEIEINQIDCGDGIEVWYWNKDGKARKWKDIESLNSSYVLPLSDSTSNQIVGVFYKGNCKIKQQLFYMGGNTGHEKVAYKDNGQGLFTPSSTGSNQAYFTYTSKLSQNEALLFKALDDYDSVALAKSIEYLNQLKDTVKELKMPSIIEKMVLAEWNPYESYTMLEVDALQYQYDHFFDDFNPADADLLRMPTYHAKVNRYLQLVARMAPFDEAFMQTSLDRFMKPLIPYPKVRKAAVTLFSKYLKELGYDDSYGYLNATYMTDLLTNNDLVLKIEIEAYNRTRPGMTAPALEGLNKKGKSTRYKWQKKTVVVFWATDCPHCAEILPYLVEDSVLSELNVVALAMSDDDEAWQNEVKRYPSWTHLRAEGGWENKTVNDYAIQGTPSFYLINKNGLIEGRATAVPVLLKLLAEK